MFRANQSSSFPPVSDATNVDATEFSSGKAKSDGELTKVGQLELADLADEEILRLDVSVQDAPLVAVVEAAQQLEQEQPHVARAQPARVLLEVLRQVGVLQPTEGRAISSALLTETTIGLTDVTCSELLNKRLQTYHLPYVLFNNSTDTSHSLGHPSPPFLFISFSRITTSDLKFKTELRSILPSLPLFILHEKLHCPLPRLEIAEEKRKQN